MKLQQGQGLGRDEQGMSQALSVEKTSKRGGRIVHEKDLMPPPMFGESFKMPQNMDKTPPNLADTGKIFSKVKLSLVISTTFEFPAKK